MGEGGKGQGEKDGRRRSAVLRIETPSPREIEFDMFLSFDLHSWSNYHNSTLHIALID